MSLFCGLCGLCDDYDGGYNGDDDIEAQGERRPLLAGAAEELQEAETDRQRRLLEKLHTYQMLRALGQGYLPSTEQAVANVQRVLDAEAFQLFQFARGWQQRRDLSPSGRSLVRLTRRFLEQLVVLLEHKNGGDQLQDFAWCVSRAQIGPVDDVGRLVNRAGEASGQAVSRTASAYRSLETVGTLLLANAPFRLFLADLAEVGRDVFRDTAVALADASQAAAENIDKGDTERQEENDANESEPEGAEPEGAEPEGAEPRPPADTLTEMAAEVTTGASKVVAEAEQSVTAKLVDNDDGARDRLVGRLKQAVASLNQRPDYAESVSVLTLLLQRYAAGYVHATGVVVDEVETAVDRAVDGDAVKTNKTNDEADDALRNFWTFLTAFGQRKEWEALESKFRKLLDRVRDDEKEKEKEKEQEKEHEADTSGDRTRLDSFLQDVGSTVQALLTDPSAYDDMDARVAAVRDHLFQAGASSSSFVDDVEALLDQAKTTLRSAANDGDIANLADTLTRIADLVLSPPSSAGSASSVNTDILGDAAAVFVPLLVQAVQYVPIPRLEVVSPDIDLLVENLVIEASPDAPPSSVAALLSTAAPPSFLPDRLHVQIRNDVDIHKTHRPGGSAALHTSATIRVAGLSVAADDVGYVARVHAGPWPWLRFADSGIASLALSGIDVAVDVDLVRDAADRVLACKHVDVRIGHLGFVLHRSRLACLAWILKPLLRPILRTTIETQLAAAIKDALQTANQELVFARERLRAARIASGATGLESLPGIVRAVLARFQQPDADVSVSVGLSGSETGVFDNVYAPGSLVRVWRDEAAVAADRIDEAAYTRDGWRNDIFTVAV